MAMTGVLRPGHAQIRVLDLEEALHFYRNVLGLVETGKDASGRHYFKGWDERDHHSVIIRQADRAGIDFFRLQSFGCGNIEPTRKRFKCLRR
jgi:catechol 2,3-dioxygenase